MAQPPPIPPNSSSPSSSRSSLADSKLLQHISPVFLLSNPTPMDDFFSVCKKMDPKNFEQILKSGQLITCGPDSIIYLQGEPNDSFYVINDGTVEVVVSDIEGENPVTVSELTKGDIFGETSLLTDVPRTASIRVPRSATLLRFEADTFRRLLRTIPAFGHYLAMVLSRRLHKTTVQLHFYSQARELSGSLDFFDLPTIFQTISISQQHGVMHIFNLTAEVMGEFAFINGYPASARYLHLYGLEALYQLFQETPHANFGFTRLNEPPIVDNQLDIQNVNEFTMNAVHMKDEMAVVEERLNLTAEKPIKRVHARLDWEEPELQACANEMWQLLVKQPHTFPEISAVLPYCKYHLLKVLDRLFETQQVAAAEMTPYGYR
jgi:CRP-like cAMP-binding protein